MDASSWQTFYYASWQWPWALLVVPFAYLAMRAATEPPRGGAAPAQAGFVSGWLLLFAAETMLDPVATGPIATAAGSETVSTALGLSFVLLGDFRVYWLVLHLLAPGGGPGRSAARAAGLTALVPVFAFVVELALARALGEVPNQVLWLVHESAFVVVSLVLARRVVPGRLGEGGARAAFLRAVLGYVVAYYGLWASADVMILAGLDEGWAIRLVPNQLYYAFFVPFVHWAFFRAR